MSQQDHSQSSGKLEPINLQQIASMDWADFSPQAKKNRPLLEMLYKYANPLRYEIADVVTFQADDLDDQTLFTLKAVYHILNQWVQEIPKLLLETLENAK